MGDRNRFKVLSAWIREHYPAARSVADVAGGQGYLSLALLLSGVSARVIDPRVTDLSRADRLAQRRGRLPHVPRSRECFSAQSAPAYDLIAGLHPDGATAEIAAAALLRPACIVPCCNYGLNRPGNPAIILRETWTQMGVRWREERLPMSGLNLIMYTEM